MRSSDAMNVSAISSASSGAARRIIPVLYDACHATGTSPSA